MDQNKSKSPRASWEQMTSEARRNVIIQALVYVVLVVLAFHSLSRQSAANLRGPKHLWKGVIPASITSLKGGTALVVPIGPLLYFTVGKRWDRTNQLAGDSSG